MSMSLETGSGRFSRESQKGKKLGKSLHVFKSTLFVILAVFEALDTRSDHVEEPGDEVHVGSQQNSSAVIQDFPTSGVITLKGGKHTS